MPTLGTLVVDDLPDEVIPHDFSPERYKQHLSQYSRYPLFSLKSGWNYGWVDMSKWSCIIEPESFTPRSEEDYGKDGNWWV